MPFDESILEDIPETQSGFDESLLEDIPDEQPIASESASLQPVTSIPIQEQPSLDQRILDVEQGRIPPTKELIAEVAARNAQRGSEPIVSIPPALVQALSGPITQGSLLAGEKLGIVPSDTRAKMAETIAGGVSLTPDMYLDAPAYITPVLGESLMAYQGGKALKSGISNLKQGNIGAGLGEGVLAALAFLPAVARIGKTAKEIRNIERNEIEQPREILSEHTTPDGRSIGKSVQVLPRYSNRISSPALSPLEVQPDIAGQLSVRPTIQPSPELVTPKSGLKVELTQEQLVKADKIINRKYPKGAIPSQVEEVLNAIRNEKPRVISNLAGLPIKPRLTPEQANLTPKQLEAIESIPPQLEVQQQAFKSPIVSSPAIDPNAPNIRIIGSPLLESQIPKAEAMLAASMREAELYPARRDFPKALAEKVSQEQTQAAAAAEARTIQPNKSLTENQIRIVQDSLKKQIENNRLKEERSGVIAGTRLEKWADDVLKGGAMHLGPDVLAAYAVKGAALYEKGFTTSAQWTGEMVKAFGNEVIPHLPMLFKEAQTLRMAAFQPKDTNAIQERQATPVLQDVREQPGQVKQALPAEASPEGVQSGKQTKASGKPQVPIKDTAGVEKIPSFTKERFKNAVQNFANQFKAKKQGPDVLVDLKNDSTFPDFQEHSVAKKLYAQPFATERGNVVGNVIGGQRRIDTPVAESIATHAAETHIGNSLGLLLAQEYSWLQKPFEIKDMQISNIGGKPGQSLFIGDVFEALQRDPNAFKLNPEQRKAFDTIMELEKKFQALEKKHQVGKIVDEEGKVEFENYTQDTTQPYFTRRVIERPPSSEGNVSQGNSLGSTPYYEKHRMFDTQREGALRGYKYDESIPGILGYRLSKLYKKIADKRLINDPALGGITRKQLEAKMRESYQERINSGEMTEAKFQAIVDSAESQRHTGLRAFNDITFDPETARQLRAAFKNTDTTLRHSMAKANNAVKTVWLGFDAGAGLIQGQGLITSHPMVWGHAMYNSVRSMASKEFWNEYVRRNIEPIREMAQLGSSVGKLEEMNAGLAHGEWLSKVPLAGPTAQAFGRNFQGFLDTAKIELWKGLREVTPKQEWQRTMQSIELICGTSRMETIGVSRMRALTERVATIAPSYYRHAVMLVDAMAEKGVPGQVARRAMAGYVLGGALVYVGIAKLLGMSWDDIKKRMNPTRPDFMMWRVGDEKNTQVGLGGIFKSLVKLGGNIYKTSIDEPTNWKHISPDKNPITKWYRGHAGPLIGLGWDLVTDKDYMGKEAALDLGLLQKTLPMTLKSLIEKKEINKIVTIATFVGASAYENPNEMQKEVKALSRKFLKDKGIVTPKFSYDSEAETYGNMFNLLRNHDDKKAAEMFWELSKKRTSTQVDRAIKDTIKNPFTGNNKLENEFFEQLSDKEKEYYSQAITERENEVRNLFRALSANPPK